MADETFASFISGQCLEACILGMMFFVSMSILQIPYALTVSMTIAVTALIPVFGAFIGCGVGAFLILVDNPAKVIVFFDFVYCAAAIRGQFDLSACRRRFGWTSVYLGSCCSDYRRRFDGHYWNADFCTVVIGNLCIDKKSLCW